MTAGPTHEPIDEVRYLANRSSGQMGIAIARAAVSAGHAVKLLLGPICGPDPSDLSVERYTTTADLEALLREHFADCDLLIMAAAVADYRMPGGASGKLERTSGGLTLQLESTPDLVGGCAKLKRADQRIIGFALEQAEQLAQRAQAKLLRKHLDAIVANPLRTMGAADIDATIYLSDGRSLSPGPMSKDDFARWLVGHLDQIGVERS